MRQGKLAIGVSLVALQGCILNSQHEAVAAKSTKEMTVVPTLRSDSTTNARAEETVWTDPTNPKNTAVFTRGSRTVTLTGPERRFADGETPSPVRHSIWVRLLPSPFEEKVDEKWTRAALEANARQERDVLATAMQYTDAQAWQPKDIESKKFAGRAYYGPEKVDGRGRSVGSDVADYLGQPMRLGTKEVKPRARRAGSLDCSGFVRMVYGFRGIPDGDGPHEKFPLIASGGDFVPGALPRRSDQLWEKGPGVVLVPYGKNPVAQLRDVDEKIRPGDILFFQARVDPKRIIDHVAIYMGEDEAGEARFISSRQSHDGPTLGDTKGASTLRPGGLYGDGFRSARRF